MEVYKAINAVQRALSHTGIAKKRETSGGAKFKFRGIDAYPSYLFYEDGRIWSKRSNRFLQPLNTPDGYQHCVLTENKTKYRHAIHRLIARAFYGSHAFNEIVNHKNGVKNDNRACNLEWATQSQNVQHSYDVGLRKINKQHVERAAALGRSKRTVSDEQIALMRSMYFGERGDIGRIANFLSVSRHVVTYHLKGASK